MIEESSNRRVAKNTIILYCRMVITMAIGVWTSRLVLNALGFTDQGLYNLVGGVIGFSSLITASISGSITRYITYEIGRKHLENVNLAVQNAITVQWILATIVVIVGETIGLWFINNDLVIPEGRLFAVNVVYQLTIWGLALTLLTGAPNSLILATERMNVYAGIAIANSIWTLCIALMISYSNTDRLILYSFLQFVWVILLRVFYFSYIRKNFKYIKFKFGYNRELFKSIFSFAGWGAIGSASAIFRVSGTSVLLNIFGGPIANTINGIANSVNSLARILVNDFTTACNPQIIKRYAAGEYNSLNIFLNQCCKLSYGLISVVAIPILFNIEPLLIIWLKKIPEGTAIFGQLIVIYSMIDCMTQPLSFAKHATGNIRNYQIVVGGILLLTIPISYVLLKLGFPLYFSYISIIVTSIFAFIARMFMLQGSIPYWSSKYFLRSTVLRCGLATGCGLIIPFLMHILMPLTTLSVIIQTIISFIWCSCCMFLIALEAHEQKAVIKMIKGSLSRIKKG